MTFIEEVHARRKKLADVLVDEEYSGIRKIVEDLYPDRAHFIYELLQNAEDAGATEVSFQLDSERLVFEHNGRPFTEDDVWGITNIGKGGKAGQEDKIGRFGVGFKAVFAYCETPHIWSPTYSFKITDLVLPFALPPKPELGPKTRFEFPFNNPKKPIELAYAEIEKGLNELAETTLLFLSYIESIRWQIAENLSGKVWRVEHSTNHFQVLKQTDGIESSSHFLKFDQVVTGVERQRVAVAYALDLLPNVQQYDRKRQLAKQLRIISAAPGRVAVYFPAEKEASGLRFHLHGPFVPELSRASVKETPVNEPLFQQLANVAAASLHQIRDLGLLTADFLSVLPNPQDGIPPRYQCVRAAIVQEMNAQPLTPTHGKGHAPAKYLLQAKASLKELLSPSDLEFLVEYEEEPPQWSVGATQKNSSADRFLGGLAITDWDTEKFVELLCERASEKRRFLPSPPRYVSEPDQELMTWLSGKSLEWHQQLYGLLAEHLANAGWQKQQVLKELQMLRIVRLTNADYRIGGSCFWVSPGAEHDEVLPRVDPGVYTSGKSKVQQQNAKELLGQLGVREVGEAEQVEAILNERYRNENFKPKLQDLKRFIALVEKDSSQSKLFAEYYIFQLADGQWGMPSQTFLDHPFKDTGLSAYYAPAGPAPNGFALSEKYLDCGIAIERIIKFAETVGVKTRLDITQVGCYSNPMWSYLSSVGGNSRSPVNDDYTILLIEEFLATPTLAKAKLIWQTMVQLPKGAYLQARYQRNYSSGSHYAPSQLVHHIRNAAWVPQGDELFVQPAAAARELLPEGFPFDSGWPWLKAIDFGTASQRKAEEQRQKQAVAKELGFEDSEALRRAQRFAALPPDEQEEILEILERKSATELPQHEPANPERRARRVGEQAVDAPERRSEERTRSVSVGLDAVKQEAGQYLREQYTNRDGEMICQICKQPLPFELDDGTPYFEKVEFLPGLRKRHYQNYLALCPNHAAMFQHANGSADLLQSLFTKLIGNELKVVLARNESAIYFTKTHAADLNTVLQADRVEGGQENNQPEQALVTSDGG